MNNEYNEMYYKTDLGYTLYHIKGKNAAASTARYMHHQSGFFVCCFFKGTGNLKIEGKHYDIDEGDVLIVNPGEIFQLNVDNNKYHERISINVDETILKNFSVNADIFTNVYKKKKGKNNRIPSHIADSLGIKSELEYLHNLADSSDPADAVLSVCKIVEMVINIGRNIIPNYIEQSEHIHENQLVNSAIKYIQNHLKDDISIDSVAEQFNVGKSYLSHLFKKQAGMSIWNYVIVRRIYLFNQLIKSNSSVEDVSYEVGFKNYSNFFRLYKKHMQMTPTEYKKQLSANDTKQN